MSYFSVKDFITSGRKSIENENYWSALSIALALPSMCSRVMFKNDDYKGADRNDQNGYWYETNNGEIRWHDKKCYVDFCKTVMHGDCWLISVLGDKFADVLYQLRCDIIHAGVANIYDDNKGLYLSLGDCSSTDFSRYRTINVKDLCEMIYSHVDIWCSNNSVDNFKYTYVFDTKNNNDDRILYNRLCERDRADLLEERFIKENVSRTHNQ